MAAGTFGANWTALPARGYTWSIIGGLGLLKWPFIAGGSPPSIHADQDIKLASILTIKTL